MRGVVGIVGVVAAWWAGCVEPATLQCGEVVCPTSLVCAPSGDGCADPAQVAACAAPHGEGDACDFGFGAGVCVGGLCMVGGCGDGTVAPGEACDDGNQASGDGCRGDCGKLEACGDAVVDVGEACDDANANAADACDACVATTWGAAALLRGAVPGIEVGLTYPAGVAVDTSGNAYVTDTASHRIRRIDATTGVITTVAGTGVGGARGDGGAATSAELNNPHGVAVDGRGNVFVADTDNHEVRRIDAATGDITTVAGTGAEGDSGDGGAATSAQLASPYGVAVDGLGNVFVADTSNHRLRRIDATTGVITTLAGTGFPGYGGDGAAASSALLGSPSGLAVDARGDVFVADTDNHRVRRIDATSGVITTVVGTGASGYSGDGEAATSTTLWSPLGVALDANGNLFVADTENQRLRRIDAATGLTTTVAGDGGWGFAGDGGPAADAQMRSPYGVAVDHAGHVYVADTFNHRLRRVDATTGLIATVAGVGIAGTSRDGGAATSAPLATPYGLATDALGNLLVVDTYMFRLRRIDAATGVISTLAGTGTYGSAGDGGPATEAQLASPRGVAVDPAGNLYIADGDNHRVRRIDAATGVITTIAGTGTLGDIGDGGPATDAQLRYPFGVAVDGLGNVFVVDRESHRLRRIDAVTGVITTVAGTGIAGDVGDGGAASNAQLDEPSGVAVDDAGNVYVADALNSRIRRIDGVTGDIATVAGTGTAGFSGDGGPAASAQLRRPRGLTLTATGDLLVADSDNQRIRRVDAVTGVISTVAGSGAFAYGGDGGPATSAQFRAPLGVAVDALGHVFVADASNLCVRRIDAATGIITTVAGAVHPEGEGPTAQAVLATPAALAISDDMPLMAGGVAGVVQALADGTGQLTAVIGRYPQLQATGELAAFRTASFGSVGGVAADPATKQIFLTEGHVVHVVTTDDAGAGVVRADPHTWTIAVLAGAAGQPGTTDGALTDARFRAPTGLFFDEATRVLYVADTGNHAVRAIDLSASAVTTVAGTPSTLGYFGDGGAATDALVYAPAAITRCAASGDLFIADAGNHRVRRVAAGSGVITTVLGDGVAASSGEGAPAATFPVDDPQGLACDAYGNLFVSSSRTVRFLPATDDHIVDGNGPVQTIYGAAPRDTFPALATSCLTGVAVIDATTTWVTDRCAGLLVELWRQPVAE